MSESFKMSADSSDISGLQARRRFMITDILNSSLERDRGPPGLDMRLLFPRLPLSLGQEAERAEAETDTDNEAEEEDGEHDDEKGKQTIFLFVYNFEES